MTQLVIGVTTEIQPFLNLKTDGNFGVGIHPAYHQNDGVQENQRIKQRRQWILLHGSQQQRDDNNDRRDFHQPGDFLRGRDTGVDKDQRQEHCASVQDCGVQSAEHCEFTRNGKGHYSL